MNRFIPTIFLLVAAAHGLRAEDPTSFGSATQIDPRRYVEYILAANMPPTERMEALKPYVDVSFSRSEIERRIGPPDSVGGFNESTTTKYLSATRRPRPCLVILYDRKDLVHTIFYFFEDAGVELRSPKSAIYVYPDRQ